ncbi:WUSCHEL-related homeobox 7-like [Zea mays]|uniref:Homeobox domain-containing protein n=2 Tax=Zea mays TaxID=4577 RepID=B8A2K2_MAIZE|nr:WUSCHEL-related homeobox 7-like [Zea mays]ACL54401.1 unknown [Zea mays]|eukprot:NP_001288514.1 WUSCHEL-related homeobox 7-like [Zea mays]
MASSFNNKTSHWPSMFRSKHAAEPWQAQPDISSSPPSLLSGGGSSSTTTIGRCLKHPLSGYSGGEERTPDPKPRWNPRPEQIRILEAIFNSGMVNPPRDEIPRIRMRLQEYGQVGDANVFYWFQNRKSRSKNKQRTGQLGLGLARAPGCGAAAPPVTPQPLIQNQFQVLASPAQAPASSSSSSSDRSSGSSKPAPQPMSATAAAMNFPGPLGAACAQMYYQAHPVAPVSALPAHKVQDPVASDEPVFQPWLQGYFLSAAEVASILGGQYRHDVPVQQQPPATLPAGAFLGLYNEVTEPTVTGHRTCAWGPAGLGQFWPVGGADHHQHHKHNTTAATNTVARDAAHEHATTLGLLQYGFEASAAMETASAAVPLAASPGTAASVATAGLTSLPASTNAVVVNYDLLQGLAVPGSGSGAVGVSTGGAPPVAVAAAPTAAQEGVVVALCITDSVTGKSVAHNVAAARLDVRAQFGEAAVLLRAVGDRGGLDLVPVPVDALGCTVEPLQHGAFYYVLV